MTVPVDPGVRPGQVIAGKYVVDRVLGAGGMGVVVAAHHIQLDEKVALKFLLPEALQSPDAIARFIREARAAVKIKNEHVARVSDVGTLDGGLPYMVMEYLEGGDLAAWLQQRGPMPVEQAVDFVLQACEAIADAHVLGIVHRDLKPANLFCIRRSDGELLVKVLDFGISKLTAPGSDAQAMTRTTALIGSPLYMSPEQMQSAKRVDSRTDLYALGVILFELVAGRTPFTAESVMELAIKVANEPAPPLRSVRPDAPAGLEEAVARCLEKTPDRRFRDVGELALAVAGFGTKRARASIERILGTLREAGVSSAALPASVPPPPVAAAATAPSTAASWGQTNPEAAATRSRRGLVVGVGAAALVAVAGASGALLMRSRAAPSALPAAPSAAAAALVPAAQPPPAQPAAAPEEPTAAPEVALSARTSLAAPPTTS